MDADFWKTSEICIEHSPHMTPWIPRKRVGDDYGGADGTEIHHYQREGLFIGT